MNAAYTVAADVAWLEAAEMGLEEFVVYVTCLPAGRPMKLSGPAYAVWHAVLDGGTADDITARTAEIAQVEATTVADDVRNFLQILVDEQLVEVQRSA